MNDRLGWEAPLIGLRRGIGMRLGNDRRKSTVIACVALAALPVLYLLVTPPMARVLEKTDLANWDLLNLFFKPAVYVYDRVEVYEQYAKLWLNPPGP